MFGPLGVPEIIAILVLALLIFGPRRLPEMGRTIGKALGEFRRATTELKRSINTEIALEDDDDRPRYSRSGRQEGQQEGQGQGARPARRALENPDDEFVVTTEGLIAPRERGGATGGGAGGGGAGRAPAGEAGGTGGSGTGGSGSAGSGEESADGGSGESGSGESGSGGGDSGVSGAAADEGGAQAPASQPGTVSRTPAGSGGPGAAGGAPEGAGSGEAAGSDDGPDRATTDPAATDREPKA